jgi:hypothetical protein
MIGTAQHWEEQAKAARQLGTTRPCVSRLISAVRLRSSAAASSGADLVVHLDRSLDVHGQAT